ncbi:sensor histidine kinase [Paenibacillus sp. OSY-SE]|uniref:sensor histidine kinase n=1 Tax=Paenibacillus sp. OSY-SE TaxID=1196323 RepID=UPI0003050CF5|nr:ATP-binding protein [Paenibacillus sp. OSY-SE]
MKRLVLTRFKTRTSMFIFMLCISLTSLICLYFVLMHLWKEQFTTYKQQALTEHTYHLSYVIRNFMSEGPLTEVNNAQLREASNQFSAPIRYFAPDRKTIKMNLKTEDVLVSTYPYEVEVPIIINGRIDGYLHAYYDLDAGLHSPAIVQYEQELLTRSRNTLGLFILAALLLSLYASHRWSRSIHQAGQLAESIVIGNRNTVIPQCGTREMASLIATINSLLAEFERQESWRTQLMQDLTHELRTPLTAVLSRLDAIIDGIYPLTKDNMLSILTDIERLYRLIEDMEKLSEAEGARFELNLQPLEMTRVVRGVYEGFLFLSKEKEIKFVFEKPHTPCFLDADPDRMVQILSNVIYNAIKYTPRGGSVVLGLSCNQGDTLIYCRDNGIGITAVDLPHIFHRFYRADKSRSRDSGGLGVGLSIAKALVESHRGTIWAESEQGEGSTFWIRFPEQNRLNL